MFWEGGGGEQSRCIYAPAGIPALDEESAHTCHTAAADWALVHRAGACSSYPEHSNGMQVKCDALQTHGNRVKVLQQGLV